MANDNEPMIINGIKYYTEDQAKVEFGPKRKDWVTMSDAKIALTDKTNTVGIGSFTVTQEYIVVHVANDLLKKALAVSREINPESVHLAIAHNGVLGVGGVNDKGVFSGAIIAPRVD